MKWIISKCWSQTGSSLLYIVYFVDRETTYFSVLESKPRIFMFMMLIFFKEKHKMFSVQFCMENYTYTQVKEYWLSFPHPHPPSARVGVREQFELWLQLFWNSQLIPPLANTVGASLNGILFVRGGSSGDDGKHTGRRVSDVWQYVLKWQWKVQ